jgi:hypothetical protein
MSQHSAPAQAHDFDFWLGQWEVFSPEGKRLGTNAITALFDTGAIAEHWQGAGGEGRSLSSYDAARGCWHQTWVDSWGSVLLLDGRLVDGAMVLEGCAPGEVPAVIEQQRITWSSDPGGVRQLWESSLDGDSWRIVFDGRYRRTTP